MTDWPARKRSRICAITDCSDCPSPRRWNTVPAWRASQPSSGQRAISCLATKLAARWLWMAWMSSQETWLATNSTGSGAATPWRRTRKPNRRSMAVDQAMTSGATSAAAGCGGRSADCPATPSAGCPAAAGAAGRAGAGSATATAGCPQWDRNGAGRTLRATFRNNNDSARWRAGAAASWPGGGSGCLRARVAGFRPGGGRAAGPAAGAGGCLTVSRRVR